MRIGVASVDFERFTADSGGTVHRLTHKECAVLKLLLESAGRAVSRDEILARAWAPDEFPTERTVDNFILRLRRLVEARPRQSPHHPQHPRRGLSTGERHDDRDLADRRPEPPQHRPPAGMDDAAGRPLPLALPDAEAAQRFHRRCASSRQLAAEVALGPVHEFNFDAAILFSDLLFPLEAMGMGLTLRPGPEAGLPCARHRPMWRNSPAARERAAFMNFQAEAMQLTRAAARRQGPDRLRRRAVDAVCVCGGGFAREGEGGAGRTGKRRVRGLQREAARPARRQHGAAVAAPAPGSIALFDTAAGEIDAATYGKHVVPVLADLLARFRKLDAHTPVTYYSRGTGPAYWDQLEGPALPVPRRRLAA